MRSFSSYKPCPPWKINNNAKNKTPSHIHSYQGGRDVPTLTSSFFPSFHGNFMGFSINDCFLFSSTWNSPTILLFSSSCPSLKKLIHLVALWFIASSHPPPVESNSFAFIIKGRERIKGRTRDASTINAMK